MQCKSEVGEKKQSITDNDHKHKLPNLLETRIHLKNRVSENTEQCRQIFKNFGLMPVNSNCAIIGQCRYWHQYIAHA